MRFRVSTPEAIGFKSGLGFKQHDITLSKEQSVILKVTKLFSNEKGTATTVFQAIKFIFICPSINQQQKLMKKDTLTDEKENEREEKIKEEHVCKFI